MHIACPQVRYIASANVTKFTPGCYMCNHDHIEQACTWVSLHIHALDHLAPASFNTYTSVYV